MKYKTYPKMKDSGIEWIGEIPEAWQLLPLKIVSKIERGKFTHRPRNDPILYDGKYPFIQTGDIERSNGEITKYSQTLNEKGLSVSKMMPENTIVMSIAANIGSTAITSFPTCFPDSVVGFRPYEMNTKFLRYFLESLKKHLNGISSSTTQKNINYEFLKPLPIPCPKKMEQISIVNYIDLETNRVSLKIRKNIQLIELLEKKIQVTITNAVTKGIDSSIEMKNSDIVRIGDVPKHWENIRLKFIFDVIKNGIWGQDPLYDGTDVLCIRVADFNREDNSINLKNPTFRHISDDEKVKYFINKGDILLERSGGGERQPVGFTVIYQGEDDAVCSNFISRLKPKNKFDSKFLNYFFASMYFNQENVKYIKQTTGIQNLDLEYLSQIYFLPLISEQKKIVDFLEKEIPKIYLIISKIKLQIKKSEEASKSLISSAVTGKICITN